MSDNPSVDNFLAHYGVKGMKWGQRRADKKAERIANATAAREKGYSSAQRKQDLSDTGRRGVRNIERRIAGGESIKSARFKETLASGARGIAFGAALIASPFALGAASRGLTNLSNNINAKRGAAEAAKILADTRGLTSYNTVSLAFDQIKGTWG